MEHPYSVEQADNKQAPGPQMRRGYYGDDHELFRQTSSLDMKYPFPQAHLFPPSSSVRGGPLKAPGAFPGENSQAPESHTPDPRFAPPDVDDKRFKGHYAYPGVGPGVPGMVPNNLSGLANLNHLNNVMTPPNAAVMYHSAGAGASTYNHLPGPSAIPLTNKDQNGHQNGLVPQIPPLHVQHEISRGDDVELNENSADAIRSKCSRCKKSFVQRLVQPPETAKGKAEPKIFKLCFHCRDLQRQRSRRWQKKTKDKHGACRRCGSEIPVDQQRFVLCPQCRKSLRIRKANRAAQGRCVHCSGPITASIVKGENSEGDAEAEPEPEAQVDAESPDDPEARRSSVGNGSFKVCQRCRENDKIRRTNLERMGNCNRCAKQLTADEHGKHKVCFSCRQKKKKSVMTPAYSAENGATNGELQGPLPSMPQTSQASQTHPHLQGPQQLPQHQVQSGQPAHAPHLTAQGQQPPDMPQGAMVPPMNFMPMEQGAMLVHPGMSSAYNMPQHQQEVPMGYATQMQQMQPMMQSGGDLYKPQMAQLPQLQPHMDPGYQQYIGYPPVNRNGLPYTGGRM